jgi:hypothetical protein
MFAGAPCPHEAYMTRELWPVDRVQKHVLGSDRHQSFLSGAASCGTVGVTGANAAAVSAL